MLEKTGQKLIDGYNKLGWSSRELVKTANSHSWACDCIVCKEYWREIREASERYLRTYGNTEGM